MRHYLLAALVLTFASTATVAHALQVTDFTPAAYAAAKSSGNRYVLNFHAPWCPVCRKQTDALKSLQQNPELEKFTILNVDYDSSTELRKELKVVRQSTVIVFDGETEVSRKVGVTDRNELRNLLLE